MNTLIWILSSTTMFTALDKNPDPLFSNPNRNIGVFTTEAKCLDAKNEFLLRDAQISDSHPFAPEGFPVHYYCLSFVVNKVNL